MQHALVILADVARSMTALVNIILTPGGGDGSGRWLNVIRLTIQMSADGMHCGKLVTSFRSQHIHYSKMSKLILFRIIDGSRLNAE